jgi:hypothetical protein
MRYSHPAIAQSLEVSPAGYPVWLTNGVATPATPTDVLLFEIYNKLQTVEALLLEAKSSQPVVAEESSLQLLPKVAVKAKVPKLP